MNRTEYDKGAALNAETQARLDSIYAKFDAIASIMARYPADYKGRDPEVEALYSEAGERAEAVYNERDAALLSMGKAARRESEMKQKPTVAITVRVEPATARAFQRERKRRGLSQVQAVTQALTAWVTQSKAQ